MRWESMHVAATGTWLPEPVTTATAVEKGWYDPEQRAADDLVSVTVAGDEVAPPDMAVQAATTALKRSGVDPGDVELLVHTGIWFQGVEMWPAASYVAAGTVGRQVTAFGLSQECNAAMSALEVAARHLQAGPERAAALVTAADRFGEPLIKRWSSQSGFVYGDGASALVLSRRPGFARLLSTASRSDNELEAVVRGPGFTPVPTREPLDLASRIGHYVKAAGGFRGATERLTEVVRQAVAAAVADADTDLDGIARVVAPASGRSKMDWQVKILGLPIEKSTWEFSRRVGHLGAGDQFAGLDHLVTSGELTPGDRVLVVGGGSGFSCTCAVLEITGRPDWAGTGDTAHAEAS